MPDLSTRSQLPEEMDQPNLSAHEIKRALHEIGLINQWLGGYHVVLSALEQLDWSNSILTIMDLGCGGGDTLRAIAIWAAKNKRKVTLIGVDWNPVMTEFAASLSIEFPNITYRVMDVFDPQLLNEKAHITMNSLFCHHFDDGQLVKLLRNMYKLSAQAVIINDLDRHWVAYYSIRYLTKFFSKAYMVKYDAPLSVARALTRSEWQSVLSEAGFKNYSLKWMWAWRWQIIIKKTTENDQVY
jgi:SAM-dependent methyltransferase